MRVEKVLEIFNKLYEKALGDEHINKPISWALYQTWKFADRHEELRNKEKEVFEHENHGNAGD